MIKILHGNCIDKIKELDDNSIDCVVSSPPYFGLRDYGVDGQFGLEKTYHDYLANTVKVFETFKPKLKDTATIWWNVGDTYAMSSMRGKDSLFRSIDQSKSGIRTVKRSIPIGLKAKDLMMIPNRVAIALQDAGWYIRSEIIWHKPNPMPESVRDRCTKSHEYLFLLSKNKKYYYDNESIKEPAKDWGTRDRTKGKYHNKGTGLQPHSGLTKSYPTKNKRSVWSITNKPYKGSHFAVFPPDLIEPCILAGSQENDIILDPFMGSGTTAMVAKSLGRYYLGCELHEDYGNLIQERMGVAVDKVVHNGLTSAFNDVE